MKRAFQSLLALLLTACAAPAYSPTQVVPTLAPAYALQDAQATGTAAARAIEATATAQADIVATEARASIALAEQQTQAAIPGAQTGTAIAHSVLIATVTEGAAHSATLIAVTLSAQSNARERAEFESNVWLTVGALAVLAVAVSLCVVVLRVGHVVEAAARARSIVIVRGERDAPLGYFLPGVHAPRYHSLTGGAPVSIEPEPDTERAARDAWRKAVRDVARDAAAAGSWSVNALCRADGSPWTERTVIAAQRIAAELGAIVDRGGNRGWDWAETWDYLTLGQALDGGALFTLPRAPAPDGETGAVVWPVFPAQSNTTQSNAKQPKAQRSKVPA